jgi:hypothetical protein
MIHYKNRKRQVHIATLDPVLAADIYERLSDYPGMDFVELIRPGRDGSEITVDDIHDMALDTRSSGVIILDARHQTLARLMQAYGKIIRFNRPDFNLHCYSVVIGDGPRSIPHAGAALGAFQKYLSDIRIDYSPAVFFADPFLNYSHEEMQELVLYEENAFPEQLPLQVQKHFKTDGLSVERARAHFRAAGKPDDTKADTRRRRQKKLARYYSQMIAHEFPNHEQQLKRSLTKKGCHLPGEALRLNIYPFFFEQWVRDLIKKMHAKPKKHAKPSAEAESAESPAPEPQQQDTAPQSEQ